MVLRVTQFSIAQWRSIQKVGEESGYPPLNHGEEAWIPKKNHLFVRMEEGRMDVG